MPNLDFIEIFLMLVFTAGPISLLFYLGWRLVRALEMRRNAAVHLKDLVGQVRSMRDHTTLLLAELSELDQVSPPTGAQSQTPDTKAGRA